VRVGMTAERISEYIVNRNGEEGPGVEKKEK
jgi:hypothetical protein